MKTSLTTRRSFLHGVGAGALTLPFVRQLQARAEMKPPRRLFIMHTPEGFHARGWAPNQAPGPLTALPTSAVLAPLEPVKDYTVAIAGLEMRSHSTQTPNLQGHYGIAHMLTGIRNRGGGTSPMGPSVDQIIAARIGARTKLPSVQLGVQCKLPSNIKDKMFNYISYKGADQPNPNEQDPLAVYRRVFAGAMPSDMTQERLRAQLLRRKSILDLVKGDLTDLRQALGASERPKLEQHLTALREVERLLDPASASAIAANCGPPKMDGLGGIDVNADQNFPLVSQAMLDIARAAFACDLTRIITLQYCTGYGQAVPSWIGLPIIHGIVHASDGADPTRRNKYEKWFCEQLAGFATRVRAFPEAGGNMLDNTLAVWMSSQGEGGGHRVDQYRVTMVGKAGGAIATNRYHVVGATAAGRAGEPHNRLLLNIAHAMGLDDLTTVGDPALCVKGPFAELRT